MERLTYYGQLRLKARMILHIIGVIHHNEISCVEQTSRFLYMGDPAGKKKYGKTDIKVIVVGAGFAGLSLVSESQGHM